MWELCKSMENLCCSSDFLKAYKNVPLRDRRIIQRMIEKRCQNAYLLENAYQAQKYWEDEKFRRELIKKNQEEEFRYMLQKKQDDFRYRTRQRRDIISKQKMHEIKELKNNIECKESKVKQRLRNLQLQKELLMCERRQEEMRKIEELISTQTEHFLDEELKKQEIHERLQNRLSQAEHTRQKYIHDYQMCLRSENELVAEMHLDRFRQIKEHEQHLKDQLKSEIRMKNHKTRRFLRKRQDIFDDSRDTAKLSANLRQFVRSVSPVPTSFRKNIFFDEGIASQSSLFYLNLV